MQKREQHQRPSYLKRIIGGTMVGLALVVGGGLWAYHQYNNGTGTYYVNSSAPMFSKEDANSKPILYLGRNAKVTKQGRGYHEWSKVTYRGSYGTRHGYVQGSKLSKVGFKYAQSGTAYYRSKIFGSVAGKLTDHNIVVQTKAADGRVAVKNPTDGKTVYVDAAKLTTKPVTFSDTYGTHHYTRANMKKIPAAAKQTKNQVPSFRNVAIQNVTNALVANRHSKTGFDQLDVWDSWPLQDAKGNLVNYHGYNVVFAMAGDYGRSASMKTGAYIYVFYKPVNDTSTSISAWKSAGKVFKTTTEGSTGSKYLKEETDEWSGSAIRMGTNNVRLFYTAFSGSRKAGGNGQNQQVLATAKLKLDADENGITVDHKATSDHKPIFYGDGKYYQNVNQTKGESLRFTADDFTLRDPHYLESNGHKYLVFEANTGTKFSGAVYSDNNNYNYANIGGSKQYQKDVQKQLVKNRNTWNGLRNQYTNGAIGIVELNNDFTVKKLMNPLVTFNSVDDETERPNLFYKNGKWYLFTDTRGTHLLKGTISRKGIFMLGFVADKLTGPYKPLNGGSGVVLSSTELNPNSRYFTYSYFVINNPDSNNLVVTSYMTKAGVTKKSGGHATFAPSFLLNISGDRTSVVNNSILAQGALTSNVFANSNAATGSTNSSN